MLARRQIIIDAAAAIGSAMIRPLTVSPFKCPEIARPSACFTANLDSLADLVT
jgi:hypothetical protein